MRGSRVTGVRAIFALTALLVAVGCAWMILVITTYKGPVQVGRLSFFVTLLVLSLWMGMRPLFRWNR